MSQYPSNLFSTTCAAITPLELNVSGPGWDGGERHVFEQPFVLVGRDERSCLRLEDDAVSRRHAYLQQLGERVFCIDLDSRTGTRWAGKSRPAGWLHPNQGIQIGPFTLELANTVGASGEPLDESVEAGDPLQDRINDQPPLPRFSIAVGNEVRTPFRMNRELVLVGRSPDCRVRLRDACISRYHCSLVRTPEEVWVIDLLSRTGTRLNGQPVRWARVHEGDLLQVGRYLLRLGYEGEGTTKRSTVLPVYRTEAPVQRDDDTSKSGRMSDLASSLQAELDQLHQRLRDTEMLRQQLADREAECVQLREQARALEIQTVELADLKARLEAAEVDAGKLEDVCSERDHWQAETQDLRTQVASDMAVREELRQRLEVAQQQLAQEREAVRTANVRLDQLSAALQEVRADFAARNAEHEAALQQLQETQQELAHALDKTRELQAELDQASERQQDAEALRHKLADARSKHDQLVVRILELEGRTASADRLVDQLRDANAETEQLRQQTRMLESQVAEAADLKARLEAAEASASKLEEVCNERDHWQAETQALRARIASDLAEREQFDCLTADLHAAQVERDRLLTEQQTSPHRAEQARARVSDLERALMDAAATHERAVTEERARWESERQALEARLEQAREAQSQAEAVIREVQARSAAEREEWRQRLEGAEAQIVWERGLSQEQSEQFRRQVSALRAERDRLAARLAQVESFLPAAEQRSPAKAGHAAETEPMQQLTVQDQALAAFLRIPLGRSLEQSARAQGPNKPTEQGRPPMHHPSERAQGGEQVYLASIEPGVEAAWTQAAAGRESLATIHNPPGRIGKQEPQVVLDSGAENTGENRPAHEMPPTVQADAGQASNPSDAAQREPAIAEEKQPGEDLHGCPSRRKDEEHQGLLRKALNFVLRK